jgi:uncharacterized protein YceK
MMRTVLLPRGPLTALCVAVLLSGCGKIADRVSNSAEATWTSTEQSARLARAERKAREARNEMIAEPAREKNAIVTGERFILRADSMGWTVVDLQSGEPASIAGTKLTGMDQAAAEKALEDIHIDLRKRGMAIDAR